MEIKDIFASIGNSVSSLTGKGLSVVNESGIVTSPLTAKLTSILIIALFIWIALHITSSFKPIVKWSIIIILGLLIGSVLFTIPQ